MLKGDLTSTPLAPLLVQLAEEQATGCLHISDVEADEALIYFKGGLVYAVNVPGRRPQLGAKLVSSGALAPEALADALEAQRTELQGWRLGELLVHLGYVDQPVVEEFVKEQVRDAIWDLIKWTEGRWKFRKNEKTREDVAPPVPVADLFHSLRERGAEWEAISAVVHGPAAVPMLSTSGGGAPETTLDPDAWSMLCKIDGERTVAELARDCGYTMFEAGHVLVSLVQAGLVEIEEDLDVAGEATVDDVPDEVDRELYGAGSVSSALVAEARHAAEVTQDEGFAALARVVSEVASGVRGEPVAEVPAETMSQISLRPGKDSSFASSIARVSAALSDVLGPPPAHVDPFDVPHGLRRGKKKAAAKGLAPMTPEEERKVRARQAAAAELAAAHALAEALRSAQAEEAAEPPLPEVDGANVVDLAVVRREAAAAAKAEAARVEAERLAAEEEAARLEAEEAARLEAERLAAEEAARLEAERLAAEEEAARLEAERLAAEEAARLEAERLAAEEAARLEAERLAAEEAARLEAERLAAEEAARSEAERLEAERLAAEEAARLAAEQEAARLEAERLEAERLAAEEAARLETERLAAEEEAARAEAERLAAEEAARLAAEEEAARFEAERLAAEEAARLEAERLEAERLAAEEAARLAAEQEAARLEAERLEAERLAAEDAARWEAERIEAERFAAEQAERLEAERLAAEEAARAGEAARAEAERLAAEEALRLQAERDLAADEAWAEYWAREAQAADEANEREAAATAMLMELAATSPDVEPTPEPQPEPAYVAEEQPQPAEVREPATVGAHAGGMMEMADTAALLRELSSLGLDDDASTPPPAPRNPSPPRAPRPAAAEKKKKRGLFGGR